jgi:hypothetical protein
MPGGRDVRRFWLDVSDKRIFENVHERANSDPHRRHEVQTFPDEQSVAKFHQGFDTKMARSPIPWERYSSSEELEAVLNTVDGSA